MEGLTWPDVKGPGRLEAGPGASANTPDAVPDELAGLQQRVPLA